MYNPRELAGQSNSLEFVEIFNSNPFFEDISNFRLSGDIEYRFPPNTILPAGGIVVVAKYPEAVRAYYGLTNVYGPFTGSLPNNGGRVRLRTSGGGVAQQVDYRPREPWPPAADGTGHSLVLSRPSYGENDPRAWSASAYVDGSPGRIDPVVVEPVSSVVINEFLANTAGEDYVELYNYSNQEVDVSGMWLTDKRGIMYDPAITNKYRIPDGTRLPPRGFIVFTQSQLRFGLEASGESLLLVNSNLTRVVDFVRFEGQPAEIPSGRYPDGNPTFHLLSAKTPGTNNAPLFIHDIVINEIMYNPISGDANDEYLELYNKGSQPVDLSRWRFVEGIDYRFPVGVTLGPGQYLVVAKNATNLIAKYPQLNTGNTYGNYDGSLADGGERIALAMPEYRYSTNQQGVVTTNIMYATVEEVTYRDGGRWGQWSDGRGSSLELIDPRSDNRLPSNWADSDETQKAPWTNFVESIYADHVYPRGSPGSDLNEIQVMILGKGECLMDDVAVRASPTGPNTVLNPNFNSLSSWVIQGNHVASRLEPPGPGNPSQSLRIVASAGGDNGANRVECDLNTTLTANTYITLEAKLRWLRGHRDVLLRLHGGGVETVVTLPVPPNLGTPGLPNSQMAANNGPAIIEVKHTPVMPAANVPVKVTARVHDPDGISSVQLRYRLDPNTVLTTAPMYDDGTNGDAIRGDGIYTAILPGQAAGTLVAFHVVATDAHPTPASRTFPDAGPAVSECLVRFGDLQVTGNLGVYRMWMTQAKYNTWVNRERLSNEPMEGTFVYGNFRAIYGAGARYRGSPFTRNYANPLSANANFVWTVPEDDAVLGSDEMNLDSLEPTARDATLLRELTSYTMVEQLGLPWSYQRFIHPVINGTHCASPVYTDSQQVNRDYVQMWFPDADEGEIYKIDDWFEFDDTPARQLNKSASLQDFTTVGGVKKKARYRWCWEKKFNGTLNDDYSSLYMAVDAFNAPDSMYVSAVEQAIDIEQWLTMLAFRHVVGDWDGYGYNRGKNQFVYLPNGGKWQMLLWDLDFSLGCTGGHGPTQDLFTLALGGDTGENHMPEVSRLYSHPYFRRIYLRALQRCADTVLQDAAYMPKLDARYQALLRNGIAGLTSPYVGSGAQGISIPAWIQQRRAYILQNVPQAVWAMQVPTVQTSALNVVNLTGLAPVTVKSLRVNGQIYPVSWTNYTRWGLTLVAKESENVFVIEACDHNDQPIAGMKATNVVYYTGSTPPAEGTVMFSEIMYQPTVTNAEYIEIYNASADFAFDLSGWRVNGLDYDFPLGSIIRPQQRIVLAKDRAAFTAAYGSTAAAAITDVYNGRLDPDGETLTLLRPFGNQMVVVDRVRYEPGAPWSALAAGGGAALQLVDGRRDHSRPLNWADGSGWKFKAFSMTNVNTLIFTNLYWRLNEAGVVYLDDIRIEEGWVVGGGTNYVVNGGFEAPLAGTWNLGTAVQGSTRVS
ncbi:MAG: lamin tail domain-containing protein, partial [Verrucomicrobiae bacterium]|nr:lamin tail domain-containing protein [Verrucomicrobiae bacterium]